MRKVFDYKLSHVDRGLTGPGNKFSISSIVLFKVSLCVKRIQVFVFFRIFWLVSFLYVTARC